MGHFIRAGSHRQDAEATHRHMNFRVRRHLAQARRGARSALYRNRGLTSEELQFVKCPDQDVRVWEHGGL
jgi:hypothetical protein